MRVIRNLVWTVCLLTVSACSVLEEDHPNPTAHVLPTIQYYSWLRDMTPHDLLIERTRLEEEYARNNTLIEGVQLALLASMEKPLKKEDLQNIIAILADVIDTAPLSMARNPVETDYSEFAQLWHGTLSEYLTALETIATQKEENQSLRESIENLQLQIDALKAIEQQLNQREQVEQGQPIL